MKMTELLLMKGRIRWGKRPCGAKLSRLSYQYPYGLWSKVLLKQTYQSEGLLISRHFKEAHLLEAFYHEFKQFVQFSVNWADFMCSCSSSYRERAECYPIVCLQDKV